MKLTKKLEAEILKSYNAYWDNYLKGDVEGMRALLDETYTQVGSAESEVFSNKKDAVQFLYDTINQIAGKLEMRNRETIVENQDFFNLIHERCDVYVLADDDWIFYSKFRATTIMQEKNKTWKIIHQHSSFPDTRTDDGENIAAEKIAKENLELKEAVKRRTVELEHKNRELEIEAAMERVRARTMTMQHSDELREVVLTIYEQLKQLNFNAQACNIVIANKSTGDREFWVSGFSQDLYPESYMVPYINHPYVNDQLDAWKQGEKYAVFEYTGKMKKDFDAIFFSATDFKNIPDDAKRIMIELPSVTFSTAFFNYGSLQALGIDALSTENADILKRFAKVFEQTYTRFLDLQKAEAQTREAQIEASLERVRARTMAMHNSEDVSAATATMLIELEKLGVQNLRGGIAIINPDQTQEVWSINQLPDGTVLRAIGIFDMRLHPFWQQIFEGYNQKADFTYYWLAGKDKEDYIAILNATQGYLAQPINEFPDAHIQSYYFGEGTVWTNSLQPHSEADKQVMKRFASVFSLTFRRYLDLQKAEAQTREAQIELGLERVRARAMAMQHSNELSDLVDTVFKELTKLDFAITMCIINIIDESTLSNMVWGANPDTGKPPQSYYMKFEDYPFHHAMMKGYQERASKFIYVIEGEEKKIYDEYLFNETEFSKMPLEAQTASKALKKYVASFTFSNFGGLQTVASEDMSDEKLDILERFGKVFDLTYTRFNDLQKAEAQAREAQIETALERVRSRSMGMQKSEELQEVIKIVYQQLNHLKINLDHAGFIVDYAPGGHWHFWIADEQDIPSKISHPWFDSVWANQFKEAKEKGADFFATQLNFEEKNKFYNELLSYIPGLPEASKDFYLGCPGLAASTVLLEYVALYIENFSGTPYTGEENTTLMRFGKVFQQTYTRFLDLQKAEAQTKEAQIEAALERVRSRALAMQNSNELIEIANVMREQMGLLGQPELETTAVHLYKEGADSFDSWYAFRDGNQAMGKVFTGSARFKIDSCELIREMMASYYSDTNDYTLEASGAKLEEFAKVLMAAIPDIRASPPKAYYHFSDFSGGSLLMVSYQPPSEESKYLITKCASVFDLAYRRYLDLKLAEEQTEQARLNLIQIQAEKKKAEDALIQLKSTQAQLIQSEKMASLGELTAGIAHEIQNPLNFVNNFSELNGELVKEIKQELAIGNEQLTMGNTQSAISSWQQAGEIINDIESNSEKINHHGKRAESIVKGMLEHSRKSTGVKEPTDINKLCDEFVRLSYHARLNDGVGQGLRAKDKDLPTGQAGFNCDYKLDLDPDMPLVNVVSQDIGRVLLNIVNNAFQACGEKRKNLADLTDINEINRRGLSESQEDYKPLVTLTTKFSASLRLCEIIITDNGPGIPESIRDKIFQPFFTTKPTGQGTGLGLSLAYDIVKAHGGELKVETKEGVGSEFTIFLTS